MKVPDTVGVFLKLHLPHVQQEVHHNVKFHCAKSALGEKLKQNPTGSQSEGELKTSSVLYVNSWFLGAELWSLNS